MGPLSLSVAADFLHVVSVLDVPEPVLGPGHVDAVQDRLLHAVPGEQGGGPEQWSLVNHCALHS